MIHYRRTRAYITTRAIVMPKKNSQTAPVPANPAWKQTAYFLHLSLCRCGVGPPAQSHISNIDIMLASCSVFQWTHDVSGLSAQPKFMCLRAFLDDKTQFICFGCQTTGFQQWPIRSFKPLYICQIGLTNSQATRRNYKQWQMDAQNTSCIKS